MATSPSPVPPARWGTKEREEMESIRVAIGLSRLAGRVGEEGWTHQLPATHQHRPRTPSQRWNVELPHTRDVCGVHAFSTSAARGNAARCSHCFCWLCDGPAAACCALGTGARARAEEGCP